jgi:hypothetical protein
VFATQIEALAEVRARHESIAAQLDETIALVRRFRDIDGVRLDQSSCVDGRPYNLLEALVYAQGVIRAFKSAKLRKGTPLVAGQWDLAVQTSQELEAVAGELRATLAPVENDDRPPLRIVSGSRIQDVNGSQIYVDVTDVTSRLVGSAERLLSATVSLADVSQVADNGANSVELEVAAEDMQTISRALREAEASLESIRLQMERAAESNAALTEARRNFAEASEAALSAASAELERLGDAASEISETLTTASNEAAVATSKREEVDKLHAQAEQVYRDIASFGNGLDAIKKRLEEAHDEAVGASDTFKSQHNTVERLIAEAEKMVSGATVAGLAKAFGDERRSLEMSMHWAMFTFLAGIALLIAASIVLAAYVLAVPLPGLSWLSQHEEVGAPTLAGVVSRAVIIIGPFWLTLFSARRYRSLFDLRQQYSHKYNMAFSMEGFKHQAPSFAEGIAAWVFTIVAANPLLQPKGRPMDAPPPLTVDALVTEAKERFDRILGGRGA